MVLQCIDYGYDCGDPIMLPNILMAVLITLLLVFILIMCLYSPLFLAWGRCGLNWSLSWHFLALIKIYVPFNVL